MSDTAGLVSGVAGRYATALFELAEQQGAIDAVRADVSALYDALDASPELRSALRDPSISRPEMGRVVAAMAQRLSLGPLMRNLIGLMATKRRLPQLPATLDAIERLAAARRGETTVSVTAATALTEAQRETLTDALARSLGQKIHMHVDVDPELLGGVVVKIGSRMIDASIRSKLANLQHTMKEVG